MRQVYLGLKDRSWDSTVTQGNGADRQQWGDNGNPRSLGVGLRAMSSVLDETSR